MRKCVVIVLQQEKIYPGVNLFNQLVAQYQSFFSQFFIHDSEMKRGKIKRRKLFSTLRATIIKTN